MGVGGGQLNPKIFGALFFGSPLGNQRSKGGKGGGSTCVERPHVGTSGLLAPAI